MVIKWVQTLRNNCCFLLARDYSNYSDTNTPKFHVTMTAEKLAKSMQEGLHKVFKLQEPLNLTNMVSFSGSGVSQSTSLHGDKISDTVVPRRLVIKIWMENVLVEKRTTWQCDCRLCLTRTEF